MLVGNGALELWVALSVAITSAGGRVAVGAGVNVGLGEDVELKVPLFAHKLNLR